MGNTCRSRKKNTEQIPAQKSESQRDSLKAGVIAPNADESNQSNVPNSTLSKKITEVKSAVSQSVQKTSIISNTSDINKMKDVKTINENSSRDENMDPTVQNSVSASAAVQQPAGSSDSLKDLKPYNSLGKLNMDNIDNEIVVEPAMEKVVGEHASDTTFNTHCTAQQTKSYNKKVSNEGLHGRIRRRGSGTACNMAPVDKTAKKLGGFCGCLLDSKHEENECHICRNIDLSDTPLLS